MRHIYKLAGILVVSMPLFGQQVTVNCPPNNGNCYTITTPTATKQPDTTVTKIDKEERDRLDNVDLLVKDYTDKLKKAETDLKDVLEYQKLMTDMIINDHGIADTDNMTINGWFILYKPYNPSGILWNGGNSLSPNNVIPYGSITN